MTRFLLAFLFLISSIVAMGQCQLYNGQGIPSPNPVWVSCNGANYTVFIQSPNAFGSLTIDWGDGSAITPVPSLVPPAFISHVYTAGIANYNLVFTELGTGCTINGLVVLEEPVNASIQIPIGGVTQTCAPSDLIFSNSSTDVSANTTFTWNFGDGSPILTFDETNAGQIITHTYEQNTVNCVTQVTLTAENYCSFGNPTIASFNPIQIYDIDDAAITASNQLLCYPDTIVHFANTTAKNCVPQGNTAQRFEFWNFGNYWGAGQDSIIDWVPFDPPAKPGYDIAFPGIGIYTIMMADSNQCGADTTFITVNIVPPPTAGISANLDSVCTGDQVTFTNLSGGGANQYRVNYGTGGGFVGVGGGTFNRTYNSAGTYTITLVANITGGTASCTDTATVDIVVLPSPNVNISLSNAANCDSTLVSFSNTTTGAVLYAWNFGNGVTSSMPSPPDLLYNVPGQYTVGLTATSANGCTDNASSIVEVYATPIAAFTPQNVCEDAAGTFLDVSTIGYGGPVVSWNWAFGDSLNSSSTLPNPVFTYADSGSYSITLIVSTANCADTGTNTVQVEQRPIPSFTISSDISCSPLNVSFTNNTISGATYLWNFGDGNTSTQVDPTHSFVNNSTSDTTFVVKMIATSAFGCADSLLDTVTVLANPIASFTSDAVLDCAPLIVNFNNSNNSALSWTWNFGDSTGSNIQNPSHIFENQTPFITVYSVSLAVEASNGCLDTSTQNLLVYPEPLFNFSIVPDSGCSPLVVNFPVAVGAVVYNWDFGDGGTSSGPSPSHTFVNTTTNNANYNIQLIATSPFGCVDTVNGNVTVFPNPTAILTPAISQGCEPLQVNFVNGSLGGTGYAWDFGDGTNSSTPNAAVSHIYSNNTNDTLQRIAKLVVTTDDGCADSVSATVNIFKPVLAQFSAPSAGCHPFSVSFLNASTNASLYSWTFGDGSVSLVQNPTHVYQNNGVNPVNFTPNLSVQTIEGCLADTSFQITVNHKPTAQILPANISGCEPLVVNFANNSVAADSNFWDFDDGTFDSTAVISPHNYPNQTNDSLFFNPTLIVATDEGCYDTAFASLTVFRQVNASFTVPQVGCHPFSTVFSNQSLNANTFLWDFDDGTGSTVANPSHVFQNSGIAPLNFNAQLSVQTIEGCADDTAVIITVNHTPVAQIAPQNFAGCQPLAVNMANNSVGGSDYLWVFGDGDSSNLMNGGTHTYVNQTNASLFYNPILIASTPQGCIDTSSASVEVYRKIESSFTAPTLGCHPFFMNITSNAINAVSWNWNFGDGFTGTGVNTMHQYLNSTVNPIAFNLTLTVQNVNGCSDDSTIVVTTNPSPNSSFNIANAPACSGQSVTFTNTSAQNIYNTWIFGTNEPPFQSSFLVFDTNFLNFTNSPISRHISLIVENNFNCKDTSFQTLVINPGVNAQIVAPNEGCTPFEVDFNNLSQGGGNFEWNFGDGTNSFVNEPTHTFENTSQALTSYSVVLKLTSPFQCIDFDTLEILVHPLPIPAFTAAPLIQTYPNRTVIIDNITSGTWDYNWKFGDGVSFSLAEPNNHLYNTWGKYKIILTAESEFCEDTTSRTIVILPPIPIAEFNVDTQACAPLFVKFFSDSEYAISHFWQFGDGATSSSENPVHAYQFSGEYDVSLTVVGPGGDSSVKVLPAAIRVLASPLASFVFNPSEVLVPNQPVSFINYSQFALSYAWDFGDSNTSILANPQHEYQVEGEFYPSLVVFAEGGCSDTMISLVPVKAIESGIIEVPNAFTPSGQSSNGGIYNPLASDNQVFFPILDGITSEDYTLSIFNRWGELLFETHELGVGWDGYYRSKLCQQDVYVWKIKGKYVDGRAFNKVGDVALIR